MKISKQNFAKKVSLASVIFLTSSSKVFGADISSGQAIVFGSFEKLLWSIIVTVQYYTLPIMTIALVLLGIKLLTSGDDTSIKEVIKNWMIKILIGGVIIFGAATIANLIRGSIG